MTNTEKCHKDKMAEPKGWVRKGPTKQKPWYSAAAPTTKLIHISIIF